MSTFQSSSNPFESPLDNPFETIVHPPPTLLTSQRLPSPSSFPSTNPFAQDAEREMQERLAKSSHPADIDMAASDSLTAPLDASSGASLPLIFQHNSATSSVSSLSADTSAPTLASSVPLLPSLPLSANLQSYSLSVASSASLPPRPKVPAVIPLAPLAISSMPAPSISVQPPSALPTRASPALLDPAGHAPSFSAAHTPSPDEIERLDHLLAAQLALQAEPTSTSTHDTSNDEAIARFLSMEDPASESTPSQSPASTRRPSTSVPINTISGARSASQVNHEPSSLALADTSCDEALALALSEEEANELAGTGSSSSYLQSTAPRLAPVISPPPSASSSGAPPYSINVPRGHRDELPSYSEAVGTSSRPSLSRPRIASRTIMHSSNPQVAQTFSIKVQETLSVTSFSFNSMSDDPASSSYQVNFLQYGSIDILSSSQGVLFKLYTSSYNTRSPAVTLRQFKVLPESRHGYGLLDVQMVGLFNPKHQFFGADHSEYAWKRIDGELHLLRYPTKILVARIAISSDRRNRSQAAMGTLTIYQSGNLIAAEVVAIGGILSGLLHLMN
ncbi:uncharacterized protein BJ171DRAFT_564115 [Polychytrium aggregatum]|uniref:uncharacterized protein n=1 Tax=Polychytrium aggregatum TaxID=110093 RepID=UPI0022FDB848|nr:uncharacterized protein BJ171DRAFT_564115 [Polychytrium aggregatum]KAI9209559.1 hypothetical protein BJ171DRAFT_564115 [Polychytrium aggregatum]